MAREGRLCTMLTRLTSLAACLALALAVAACSPGESSKRYEFAVSQDVDEVKIESDGASIDVFTHTDAGMAVVTNATWRLGKPTVETKVSKKGVATIKVTCGRSCSAKVKLSIRPNTKLTVDAKKGSLTVGGAQAVGDVELEDGDVELNLYRDVVDWKIDVTGGRIGLRIPGRESYELKLQTEDSDQSDVDLVTSGFSLRKLDLKTSGGDIEIESTSSLTQKEPARKPAPKPAAGGDSSH